MRTLLLSIVAALLLSPPAQAETVIGNGQTSIDLNNDGVADVSFFNLPDCPSGGFIRVSTMAAGGGIVSHGSGTNPNADLLSAGSEIGPGQTYVQTATIMTCGFGGADGPWAGVGVDGYLGVRFVSHGVTDYAWLLLRHHSSGAYVVVITNSQPGSIAAGDPGPICGFGADFNLDGDSGTDLDIEDFFRCLAGSCCRSCLTADLNRDGDAGTDADIKDFFRVLAGGC
jgi:hypothetical protein